MIKFKKKNIYQLLSNLNQHSLLSLEAQKTSLRADKSFRERQQKLLGGAARVSVQKTMSEHAGSSHNTIQ